MDQLNHAIATALLLLACPLAADEGTSKSIQAYLTACERFGFSGSVLVVDKGKTVVAQGYGWANREARTPNTVDTLFEIASATKPFTACAILKLVEDGKLALDDPIDKHLPGVPEDKRGITVRHLLSHTSGMPRSAAGGHGGDIALAVRGYLKAPLARKPGAAFEYWNGGYALLAAIVEGASKGSYVDFCREHLFRKAGLDAAGFTGDTELPRQAMGYSGETPARLAAGHPYGSYGYQYRGMGGIVVSAKDLLKFWDALHAGRVLRPQSVKLMETAVTKNYGLGWGTSTTKRGTRRIGHGGDVRGFHVQAQRFPDEDATVIVMCNVDGIPTWTIAWNLEALLLGGTPPYPMPPTTVAMDDAALDRYVGRYAIDKNNRVHVERVRSGLRVSAEGLAACRLLGASPPGAASVAAAEKVVASVRAGDPAPIKAILGPGIPLSWPRILIDRIWTSHLGKWGELRRATVIGAQRIGRGRDSVLVRLDHAKGSPRVKIVMSNGKLNIFDLKGPRFAVSRMLQPVGEGRFAAFAFALMRRQPSGVRFEEDGDAFVLIVGDGRLERER